MCEDYQVGVDVSSDREDDSRPGIIWFELVRCF